jgi:hypothetical protein
MGGVATGIKTAAVTGNRPAVHVKEGRIAKP